MTILTTYVNTVHSVQPRKQFRCSLFITGSSRVLTSMARLREDLLDTIEPNFGLLDDLVALSVLTYRQRQDVDSVKAVYKKNSCILDCLTTEELCVKFLEALNKTNQAHVVNLITNRDTTVLRRITV